MSKKIEKAFKKALSAQGVSNEWMKSHLIQINQRKGKRKMLKLKNVDKEVLHLLNESLSNWLVVTESLIKILGQVIKTQEETKFLLTAQLNSLQDELANEIKKDKLN